MKYKDKSYRLEKAEEMLGPYTGSCKGCAFDHERQCPGTDSTFMVSDHIACEPEGEPMIFKEGEL